MDAVIAFVLEAKKAVTAAAGTVAMLLAQGALADPYRGWAVSFLAVATAAGVYTATNKPAL